MADIADELHELDEVLAEVELAERAAGMSRSAVAMAQARMNLEMTDALDNIRGYKPLTVILAVRLAALRNRLRAAQDC